MALGTCRVYAQRVRLSPHETISELIDGSRIMIVYGRPFLKDPRTGEPRVVWGGLVPSGKIWRTGADEASLFLTEKSLVLNGTILPAGVYSLYSQLAENGSMKLIFNRQVGHWGTFYNSALDQARVDLVRAPLSTPVEQFTISIERAPAGGGVVRLSWANAQYSIAFAIQG